VQHKTFNSVQTTLLNSQTIFAFKPNSSIIYEGNMFHLLLQFNSFG